MCRGFDPLFRYQIKKDFVFEQGLFFILNNNLIKHLSLMPKELKGKSGGIIILSAKGFDARRCLSYLTIEYRDELSKNIGEMMGNCFYGCDRCQGCCPHNRFATETAVEELNFLDSTFTTINATFR